jgi:CheY-like chemotaxis protein
MTTLGETILVVDDDPYIQEALGDRLESLGYRSHGHPTENKLWS